MVIAGSDYLPLPKLFARPLCRRMKKALVQTTLKAGKKVVSKKGSKKKRLSTAKAAKKAARLKEIEDSQQRLKV